MTDKIGNPALGAYLQDLLKGDNPGNAFLTAFLPKLVGLAIVIGVVAFFFFLVMGAVQWIMSGGDKGALETARGKIINAIVGLLILFSVFAVISLIETVLCVRILSIDLGPLKLESNPADNQSCPGEPNPPTHPTRRR